MANAALLWRRGEMGKMPGKVEGLAMDDEARADLVSRGRLALLIAFVGVVSGSLMWHALYGSQHDMPAKIAAYCSGFIAALQVPLLIADLLRLARGRSGSSWRDTMENHQRHLNRDR
jgi:hypothetical protein